MKRKVNRRTFAQIRAEHSVVIARFLRNRAETLKSKDQPDEAVALVAAAGMIMAGFAEKEGKG